MFAPERNIVSAVFCVPASFLPLIRYFLCAFGFLTNQTDYERTKQKVQVKRDPT